MLSNNLPHSHNLVHVEYGYVSSKKIINAYKTNGFYGAVITGRRGIGKSTYALLVLHDVFCILGYDDKVAWEMAIDRMLFEINDIVDFLKKSAHVKHEMVFTWDDASVYGSSHRWFINPKEVHLLQSMMDTIRTSVNSILLTCPSQSQLLKFLRKTDDYIVQITYGEKGGRYRTAKGYLQYTLPSGTQRIYPSFHDNYYCYLPVWVFEKYMEKRESINIKNVDNLERVIGGKKVVRRNRRKRDIKS